MASSSKKRTTMAKIARENAVRERRLRKQSRKDARKQQAAADAAAPLGAQAADGPAPPQAE